jgi:hypothetical protein
LLSIAKVFEAAYAYDAIKRVIIEREFLREALLKPNTATVEFSSQIERSGVRFKTDGWSGILRKMVCPIAIAATDVQEAVLFCGSDSTEELVDFATAVQGANAFDRAHETSHCHAQLH